MARQQLRSLADDYGLKPPPVPSPSTPPSSSSSLQVASSAVAKDPKQEAEEGDSSSKTGEGTSEDVEMTVDDDTEEGNKLEQEQMDGDGVEGEEEEEEECGFCLFMKGGGCRENFIAWEKCVEDAEKKGEDIVEKCSDVTGSLMKCMEAHADYYEPILRAEKAMKEELVRASEQAGEAVTEDAATATASTE